MEELFAFFANLGALGYLILRLSFFFILVFTLLFAPRIGYIPLKRAGQDLPFYNYIVWGFEAVLIFAFITWVWTDTDGTSARNFFRDILNDLKTPRAGALLQQAFLLRAFLRG